MNWNPILLALAPALVLAQTATQFEGRDGHLLDSGKVKVTILSRGGAFTSLVLNDDPERMNPMWNPIAAARAAGGSDRFGDSIGHFVCVDGFGPTSPEEQRAGLQGHGEAHRQPWQVIHQGKHGNETRIEFQTTLPLVHEVFRRNVSVIDGEQVVYVESQLENLLAFDRPINWAEHGTIGSPFLAPQVTVVDASVGQCETRPHGSGRPANRRLASEKEFKYPMAPLGSGSTVDLRAVPAQPNSMDHTGCLLDPARRLAFITALRLDKRLLFGYVVRREEYPWLQEWMNYPSNGALARGLEFGTQPFDVPRRRTVEMGTLFGVPAYRWLPAKSTIGSQFLMFLTRVPEGFKKVDDVRQEGGKLIIEDKSAGKKVELAASRPL